MPESPDLAFGRIAIRLGLLTAEQVEAALQARTERPGAPALPAWLAERGLLAPEQAAEVERRVALEGSGRQADATVADATPNTRTCAPDPRSELASTPPAPAAPVAPSPGPDTAWSGRYRLQAELGRGGMGVVYQAWDQELGRPVALKMLLPECVPTAAAVERFLHEARAAARLRHPNIVQVHDVGTFAERHYFTMDFIEGETLESARARIEPRRFLEILRAVAFALHAAHEAGVIHRDVKPANILLDRDLRPYVGDFGLAKEVSDAGEAGMTRTGAVLGTPRYMSPEQANGEAHVIGPRSDVWSLGVILYEHLAGTQPFPGTRWVDIVLAILTREPVSPARVAAAAGRRVRVHRDLETICLKCLEKDPAHRYATAADLAADLGRFLGGEPIEARPPSVSYRLHKWVARRRWAVAAAAAFLAVGTLAGISTWRARASEEKQARLERESVAARLKEARLQAEVLDGLRTIAGSNVAAALLVRRAGGRMAEAQAVLLAPLERAVQAAVARAPGLAEPHYHLGRMYRALLRFDPACAQQDLALGKQQDFAPSRYERAILRARAYGERLAALRSEWLMKEGARLAGSGALGRGGLGGVKRAATPTDDELARGNAEVQALKRGIAADLERLASLSSAADAAPPAGTDPASAVPAGSQALSAARLDCARGIRLAYASAGPEETQPARELLRQAIAGDPTLEEAYEALARIERAAGGEEKAIEVYTRGLTVDPGYVPHLLGRGEARAAAGLAGEYRGEDPASLYAASIRDFDRAVDLDPDAFLGWRDRGSARGNWAACKLDRGEDPSELLAAAIADYNRALELDPAAAEVWADRGGVRSNLANYRQARGGDATEEFVAAVADLGRAIQLKPTWDRAWILRGGTRANWAFARQVRGEDPSALLGEAIGDLDRALALNPDSVEAWLRRGGARVNQAIQKMKRGEDPSEVYAAAVADLGKTLELDPASAEAWMKRGGARGNWANYVIKQGRDPEELFAAALADLDQALALNPASADACSKRGGLRLNWGSYEQRRQRDPSALYRAAGADLEASLRLNPDQPLVRQWLEQARARLKAAGGDAAPGSGPAPGTPK